MALNAVEVEPDDVPDAGDCERTFLVEWFVVSGVRPLPSLLPLLI